VHATSASTPGPDGKLRQGHVPIVFWALNHFPRRQYAAQQHVRTAFYCFYCNFTCIMSAICSTGRAQKRRGAQKRHIHVSPIFSMMRLGGEKEVVSRRQ
jgi:hypothetical protein